MPEYKCELFHLPQELQDQIFDDVIDDAEIVFCHPQGSAMSNSKVLIVCQQFHANYRSALRRRGDKFPNHRISVDFQLCGKVSTTPLPTVNINLPTCATGLHVHVQVTKSGVLCTGGTSSTLVSGLHDIGAEGQAFGFGLFFGLRSFLLGSIMTGRDTPVVQTG